MDQFLKLMTKLMTKKKNPNSSSPRDDINSDLSSSFDDFKLDDKRFKELFEQDDSLENTTQYFKNLLTNIFDHLSSALPPKQPKSSLKKNPHLKSFKDDFSHSSKAPSPLPPKPSTQEPSSSPSSPSHQSITPGHFKISKKSITNTPISSSKKESSSQSKPIIKKSVAPINQQASSKPINFFADLKQSFQSVTNIFNKKTSLSQENPKPPKATKSMNDSLERLKKREEDIKNLLDNNKGNIT